MPKTGILGIREDYRFGPIRLSRAGNRLHKWPGESARHTRDYPYCNREVHPYRTADLGFGTKNLALHAFVNNEGSLITWYEFFGTWGLSFWQQKRDQNFGNYISVRKLSFRPSFWREEYSRYNIGPRYFDKWHLKAYVKKFLASVSQ